MVGALIGAVVSGLALGAWTYVAGKLCWYAGRAYGLHEADLAQPRSHVTVIQTTTPVDDVTPIVYDQDSPPNPERKTRT